MKMKLNVDHPEKFSELVKEVPIENLFQVLQMGGLKLNPWTNQLTCFIETLDLLDFPKSHQTTFDA